MSIKRQFRLCPVVGWGWFIAGVASPELPAPFRIEALDAEPGHWSGKVIEPGHPFNERSVDVVDRHRPLSGQVTVMIEPRNTVEPATTGFATMWEAAPDSPEVD